MSNKFTQFDESDIFDTSNIGGWNVSQNIGKIGMWLLHGAKLLFLLYSGVHGVSASIGYAGNSEWQIMAQIFGIVVIEVVLFSLYLAAMNQKIQGSAQVIAAGLTYLIGFILACLGIVGDSQLNAGMELSSWLSFYLRWLLPVAPAVMAFGALLTHILSPQKLREIKEADMNDEMQKIEFETRIAERRADLMERRAAASMRIGNRRKVLQQLALLQDGDDVKTAIGDTANRTLTDLLRAAGIDNTPESNQTTAKAPIHALTAPGGSLPTVTPQKATGGEYTPDTVIYDESVNPTLPQ